MYIVFFVYNMALESFVVQCAIFVYQTFVTDKEFQYYTLLHHL